MSESTSRITTGMRIGTESNWNSGKNNKTKIRLDPLPYVISMLILCIGAVRGGHESFTLNPNRVLMVLNVFLFLTTRRMSFFNKELYLFLAVVILEVPLQWLTYGHYSIGNAYTGIVTLTLMLLNVSLMIRRGYVKYLWRVVNFISLLSCGCLIVQMLCYWVGIRLDQMGLISEFFFKAWDFTSGFRPCSLFSEPSHLAEFALLSLYYYLLIAPNMRKAAVIGLGLCLSTSGLGIIGMVLLIALYVLNLNRNRDMRPIKKYIILSVVFLASVGMVIWISTTSNWVIARILSGGTSNLRVLRSFELYHIMEPFGKLLGIGLQNQALYLNYHSIILPSDTIQQVLQNREFAQTLGYILCTTGALGFCVFMLPFIKILIRAEYRIKILCLLFLFICLTCCTFSRLIFGIHLLMLFATAVMIRDEARSGQTSQDVSIR